MLVAEMEQELIQRGIIAPHEYTPEQIKETIMEIIVTEGKDSSLGRQIWQYCKVVEFEYEAIRPIIEKEPRFFSMLEELGSLQFNLMLMQIKELRAIKTYLAPKIMVAPGSIKEFKKEWEEPGSVGLILKEEIGKEASKVVEEVAKEKPKEEISLFAELGI